MEVKFTAEAIEEIEQDRLEILREIYPFISGVRKIFPMEQVMGRVSKHKGFKEALFSFVAERPYLNKDNVRFLREILDPKRLQAECGPLPFFEKAAVWKIRLFLRIPVLSWFTFFFVRMIASLISRHFIPAESIQDIQKKYVRAKQKVGERQDFHFLSEDAMLNSDIENYKKEKIKLIRSLHTSHYPPRYRNVSYKPSALIAQPVFKQVDSYTAASLIWSHLHPILKAAMEANVRLTSDAELEEMRITSMLLFEMVIGSEEFRALRKGKAEQMYFCDSFLWLRHTISRIRVYTPHVYPVLLRILKGAYWDTEMLRARKNRWPYYLYTDIYDSHASLELGAEMAMENIDVVIPAIASHNIFNQAYVIAACEHFKIADRVVFQKLWNMGEKEHLRKEGFTVEEYVSYGKEGADAFLARRVREDSENESVLQMMARKRSWDDWMHEVYRICVRKAFQRERFLREVDRYEVVSSS